MGSIQNQDKPQNKRQLQTPFEQQSNEIQSHKRAKHQKQHEKTNFEEQQTNHHLKNGDDDHPQNFETTHKDQMSLDEDKNGGDFGTRKRIKMHRDEVAGKVWIPDTWGQEGLLKDWVDSSEFDANLMPQGVMLARAALAEEGRRPASVTLSSS